MILDACLSKDYITVIGRSINNSKEKRFTIVHSMADLFTAKTLGYYNATGETL